MLLHGKKGRKEKKNELSGAHVKRNELKYKNKLQYGLRSAIMSVFYWRTERNLRAINTKTKFTFLEPPRASILHHLIDKR